MKFFITCFLPVPLSLVSLFTRTHIYIYSHCEFTTLELNHSKSIITRGGKKIPSHISCVRPLYRFLLDRFFLQYKDDIYEKKYFFFLFFLMPFFLSIYMIVVLLRKAWNICVYAKTAPLLLYFVSSPLESCTTFPFLCTARRDFFFFLYPIFGVRREKKERRESPRKVHTRPGFTGT